MLTQRLISGVCSHGIKEEYLTKPQEAVRSTPPSAPIIIRSLRPDIGQDSVRNTTPEPQAQVTERSDKRESLSPASTEPSSITSSTSGDSPTNSPGLYSSPETEWPEQSVIRDPHHEPEVTILCLCCYF